MAKSTATTIEKDGNWVCNECNFPNYTSSVSQKDIEEEKLSCINCGGFEFHKQEKKGPATNLNFDPIKNSEITLTIFVQPEIEKPHCIKNDKRYEEPFEDDGAYAD